MYSFAAGYRLQLDFDSLFKNYCEFAINVIHWSTYQVYLLQQNQMHDLNNRDMQ